MKMSQVLSGLEDLSEIAATAGIVTEFVALFSMFRCPARLAQLPREPSPLLGQLFNLQERFFTNVIWDRAAWRKNEAALLHG